VQPGTNFSTTPSSITMNENTTTNLISQAGGALKVYWYYVNGAQETLIAVDQLSLTYSPGRVTGPQSFSIQFRAVYPTEVKTNTIPVTVNDTIPDPVFTLLPSTNLWDGRTVMTVKTSERTATGTTSTGKVTFDFSAAPPFFKGGDAWPSVRPPLLLQDGTMRRKKRIAQANVFSIHLILNDRLLSKRVQPQGGIQIQIGNAQAVFGLDKADFGVKEPDVRIRNLEGRGESLAIKFVGLRGIPSGDFKSDGRQFERGLLIGQGDERVPDI